jgi:hypothetical protein
MSEQKISIKITDKVVTEYHPLIFKNFANKRAKALQRFYLCFLSFKSNGSKEDHFSIKQKIKAYAPHRSVCPDNIPLFNFLLKSPKKSSHEISLTPR